MVNNEVLIYRCLISGEILNRQNRETFVKELVKTGLKPINLQDKPKIDSLWLTKKATMP